MPLTIPSPLPSNVWEKSRHVLDNILPVAGNEVKPPGISDVITSNRARVENPVHWPSGIDWPKQGE
jgi:hypothetical protein